MRERFATGGGTPQPSQVTDELQIVGAVTSHMAVRLPNPYDSDRSRHGAVVRTLTSHQIAGHGTMSMAPNEALKRLLPTPITTNQPLQMASQGSLSLQRRQVLQQLLATLHRHHPTLMCQLAKDGPQAAPGKRQFCLNWPPA
ncbi:hypothetical protein HPB50_010464 [Hyalomma asiaticum]|uniref:Uncharacterized protein n=1 Tax=Hyalomma asiaticum TaxID=266040 RepID=A0ACB7SVA1_HYAAI|nr:hypothetical protein HPB50_010464 [Hyalomma asiaticum]